MSTAAVILAAGKGKRMRSDLPKVLHPVLGKPMVVRAAETAEAAGVDSIIVVVGHGRESVIPILEERGWNWAVQEKQLGTAHAVMSALPLPEGTDQVLVLLGDVPLLRSSTVSGLLASRIGSRASMAVLTTEPPEVHGYGRVITDDRKRVLRIVEQKDATPEEASVRVINTGIMAFDAGALLGILPEIGRNNAQGEYYLTDAVSILAERGETVLAVNTPDWHEVAGVNDPVQLAACTLELRKRNVEGHLRAGVVIPDPGSVWIEDEVVIGRGASLGRNCRLSGETVIGPGAELGDGTIVIDGAVPAGGKTAEYTVIGAE